MMKVVSILLVVLLLLNVMGYYGFFLGLKYQHAQELTQRLDSENYSKSETVTFRIPLVVPYYGDTGYQRVNGEIEHHGEFYRLVKQKLQKDTLYIVCIKDVRGKHIQKALKDYVKTFADQSAEKSGTKNLPIFIKDYVPASFSLFASAHGWSLVLYYHEVNGFLSNPFSGSLTPPPKFL